MTSTFLEEYGASSFSMSKNLSEFLNFFGNYFNPNKVGMNGKEFFPLQAKGNTVPEHMVVLDILNKNNNTTKSAFRIWDIK